MTTEEYVVVTMVQGQFDEQQVRAFLEAHGIPTTVRGEALRHTHGLSVAGLGAVEILAPRDHAESARRLSRRPSAVLSVSTMTWRTAARCHAADPGTRTPAPDCLDSSWGGLQRPRAGRAL